jgi:DNA repair exonuclease SbcCD nuclease subunit
MTLLSQEYLTTMRVIITADIHSGIPDKLNDTTWAIRTIRQYAESSAIEHVIVAGDLFHDRQHLGLDVLRATYDELLTAKKSGQKWHSFPGNHDMFMRNSWEVTSLHALSEVMNITETTGELHIEGQRFFILPFIHYESRYMEEIKKLDKQVSKEDILLTHIGVNKALLNVCFLLQNWSIVDLEDTKFYRIYTGHFHCEQQVGKVYYPGSPIPFNFAEGATEHGFYVYDIERREHQFIKTFEVGMEPRPPNYLTINDQNITENINTLANNKIRIKLSRDYTTNELGRIKELLKKRGALAVDWSLPETKTNEEDTAKAAVINISSPEALFKAWLEHDDPNELDKDLLIKINEQVKLIAEERYVVQEDSLDT